jgi:hypothetical protein
MSYSEDDLPEGMNEDTLCIAFWDKDTGTYVPIDGVLDTEANTITALIGHFSRYTVLSLPRPATFVLSDLVISPAVVNLGGSIDIRVTIANNGDYSGSYTCSVMIDDSPLESRVVTIGARDRTTLHFTITAAAGGTFNVRIGELTGSYNVTLRPASFSISSLTVSADEVNIGEEVEVSVAVRNTGQSSGSYEVELNVNGNIVETKDVLLAGGEEQNVTFTLSADEAGKKMVDVNGLVGEFLVRGEVAPPEQIPLPAEETPAPEATTEADSVAEIDLPSGTNWPLILGISGGCLVLAACVAYFTRRRRRANNISK